MKLRLLATATLVALALTAGTVAAQDVTSEKGKLSYALGYKTGIDIAQLVKSGEQIDIATLIKAMQDASGGKQPAVAAEQLQAAIDNMQRREMARAKAEFDKIAPTTRPRAKPSWPATRLRPA
jgi:peptidylprolyl isomerase